MCTNPLIIVYDKGGTVEVYGECFKLEKWFPLQGERGHSSYFMCFQEQNREEGETE